MLHHRIKVIEEHLSSSQQERRPEVRMLKDLFCWTNRCIELTTARTALDNGQRSPRKLLRAVIARLLGRKS